MPHAFGLSGLELPIDHQTTFSYISRMSCSLCLCFCPVYLGNVGERGCGCLGGGWGWAWVNWGQAEGSIPALLFFWGEVFKWEVFLGRGGCKVGGGEECSPLACDAIGLNLLPKIW